MIHNSARILCFEEVLLNDAEIVALFQHGRKPSGACLERLLLKSSKSFTVSQYYFTIFEGCMHSETLFHELDDWIRRAYDRGFKPSEWQTKIIDAFCSRSQRKKGVEWAQYMFQVEDPTHQQLLGGIKKYITQGPILEKKEFVHKSSILLDRLWQLVFPKARNTPAHISNHHTEKCKNK